MLGIIIAWIDVPGFSRVIHRLLEMGDEGLLSSQALFPIEQEVAEACVPGAVESPRLTDRGESAVDQLRLDFSASNLTKDLGRTVPPILAAFMGLMALEIVVTHPFLMHRDEFVPGLGFLEIPISHPALYIERGLYI